MDPITINLIGAGRVGKTFLSLMSDLPGCCIQDVLSATYTSAQNAVLRAGAGQPVQSIADLRPADLWIIAVPDTQISAIATDLDNRFSDEGDDQHPSVAFHCSGFFPADQMACLRRLNWQLASVHPVLSFADPDTAKAQFDGTLCGLEGDKGAIAFVQPLLEKLKAQCFLINSDKKSLYHAAAVISNNFTVVLQAIAREAWSEAGVADGTIEQLNAKLLASTVENVAAAGPQSALTGPAARGDNSVVTSQGRDVSDWHSSAGKVYKELSAMAHDLKTHGTTKP